MNKVIAAAWLGFLMGFPFVGHATNHAPTEQDLPAAQAPAPVPDASVSLLSCEDRVSALSGERGSVRVYRMEIPPETRHLTVRMSGGTGDADMYLRLGAPPTLETFDARPFVQGNEEEWRIRNPEPGEWYLLLHAAEAYAGVEVEVHGYSEPEETDAVELQFPFDLDLAMYYELSGAVRREESRSGELRNQALHQEGRTAFTMGDYTRALDSWSQWAEADPTNPDPVSLVGDIHLRQDNVEEAIRYYRKSLDIQPGRIFLMLRLTRLLDTNAQRPEEARDLLNRYSRLFPTHPDIALAQAEWLIRRRRYDEAYDVINSVIRTDPHHLRGRALLHGLLETPEERFANMRAMKAVGEQPGMERVLGQAIQDNHLLTRPEAWVLMDFIERQSIQAKEKDLREFFARLLPRKTVAVEDFTIGRLTRNWISSRDQIWNEEGNLVLGADTTQTEAYLRLEGSDALHNGFIEAGVEDTRGYFWLYARRGEGGMIRFGFDETGQLYQQIWMNGQLRTQETRLWSKPPGETVLRIEVKADGAFTFVDGRPAFSSPLSIPPDMGLGWWGIAPWAPEMGRAAATVHQVAGGPLPVRMAWIESHDSGDPSRQERERLHEWIRFIHVLIPDGFARQDSQGRVRIRGKTQDDYDIRLLSRYYRIQLMPILDLRNPDTLDWPQLIEEALNNNLNGFTLRLPKMPSPAWVAEAEERLAASGISIILVVFEPGEEYVLFREIAPGVGLFPGPRCSRRIAVLNSEDHRPETEHSAAEGMLLRF